MWPLEREGGVCVAGGKSSSALAPHALLATQHAIHLLHTETGHVVSANVTFLTHISPLDFTSGGDAIKLSQTHIYANPIQIFPCPG